jgi:maleylpyruvate isomerase
MYREPDGRDADIEAGARRGAADLVADVRESAQQWMTAARGLPWSAWGNVIQRRPHHPPEPAAALVIGRLWEVEFHHVDLDLGYTFASTPSRIRSLALDAAHQRLAPLCTDGFTVRREDGQQLHFGAAVSTVEIHGSDSDLLAWLTGRSSGDELRISGGRRLPAIPDW